MKKSLLLLLLFTGMVNAQIISFPDANFKATLLLASPSNEIAFNSNGYVTIDTNSDGEIQNSEALAITLLSIPPSNIQNFSGIENFLNLTTFHTYNNPVNNFSLNGLANLSNINIDYNFSSNTVFNFTNLPALTYLSFYYSNVTSLTISNANNLQQLNIWGNLSLNSLQIGSMPNLRKVLANDAIISNFSIANAPILNELNLSRSNLTSININSYPLLEKLNLDSNLLTSISGFTNLNNLQELNIQGNLITNMIFPPMPNLRYLICGSNGYSSIDVSSFPQLRALAMNNNAVSSINFSNNLLLQQLNISQNTIASADFSMLANLTSIGVDYNLFTELDLSGSPLLNGISFSENPNLTHVNLKSGTINTISYSSSSVSNLSNLNYICVDEGDIFNYNFTALPNVIVTSYCTFTPGGDFNTITGLTRFDSDSNGCDNSDFQIQHLKVNIDDGSQIGSTFSNNNGYTFYTEAGSFNVTPQFENPSYFNVTPSTFAVNFPDDNNNLYTQNLCVSANGIHSDLEVVVAPIIPARPGFNAVYKIVYKNKGNQFLPITAVTFAYNDDFLDFVSASEIPGVYSNVGSIRTILWQLGSLNPFESKSFTVTLLVNAPTDSPAVNIGDILTITTSILNDIDETPNDNVYIYNQTVVGSFDPNDITCLEGETISPSEIGGYLRYMINFENTGTFQAENVVVRDEIDLTKYDINSLQILNTSHNAYTRINGNKVEFIFEGINLAATSGTPPVGGHGNVLFKIRSKNTLVNGDSVQKRANIYFDYNAPINTNMAVTTFQSLNNSIFEFDNSIQVYPNPTVSIINIKSNHSIKSIELYDIQGRILETSLENSTESTLDISKRETGIYFLKITTEEGSKVEKIMKE